MNKQPLTPASLLRLFAWFATPLLFVILLLWMILSWHVRNQLKQHRFPSGTHILAMGDSHIQTAVADSLLPGVRNIARSNESYLYSYYKLRYLIHSNPSIDTVILGVAPHNLSDYYDAYLLNPSVDANYFWILPPDVQVRILAHFNEPIGFLATHIHTELKRFNAPPATDTLWLGRWTPITIDRLPSDSSICKRIRFQFFSGDSVRSLSSWNLRWLEEISRLCHEKGIALLALQTPVHPVYERLTPTRFSDAARSHSGSLPSLLSLTAGFPSDPDLFLPDGDHLSREGAIRFSREWNLWRTTSKPSP